MGCDQLEGNGIARVNGSDDSGMGVRDEGSQAEGSEEVDASGVCDEFQAGEYS